MQWVPNPWFRERFELRDGNTLLAWTQPCPKGYFVRVVIGNVDVMDSRGLEEDARAFAEEIVWQYTSRRPDVGKLLHDDTANH